MSMSDNKHIDSQFTNEATQRRRAWIEQAVDSVRGRMSAGEDDTAQLRDKAPRPALYVVGSARSAR